jgi:hypothetical protein
MRVTAARRGEIGQVGTEVQAAAGAVVSGVDHVQVARPVSGQAAQVVQEAVAEIVAVTTAPTARAGAAAVVP